MAVKESEAGQARLAVLGRLVPPRPNRWALAAAAAVLAAALIVGGIGFYRALARPKLITAYFSESIGVYPGSTVRILGVPIGSVVSVKPEGSRVKVTMTVNHGVAVPARADAVVISPSVVADRYIQLTPAYTGGPQLADGAVIPLARTAVPVEVDQVYASLAKLANAFGPNGANKHGALSGLIKTGAANLAGNGTYLRKMITEFGGLSKTLGGSAGNLFATLAYLQQFTTTLKDNNGQVRQAEAQLAQVSAFLASDRHDLAAAISELAVALGRVKSFIGGNRALLESNVRKLAAITSLLVRERASLAMALDVAPLAADNLVHAYNVSSRTLVGRGYLAELIRGNVPQGAFTTSDTQPSGAMGPIGAVPVPLSVAGSLPPLPLPSAGPVYGTPAALLGVRR